MNSFFTIGERNGSIATLKGLDFEVRRTYTFEVRVKDCSLNLNVSECSNITNVDKDVTDVTKVTVNVLDINDNPPVFKQSEITVGMRRITEVGVPLDLSLKVVKIPFHLDTMFSSVFLIPSDNIFIILYLSHYFTFSRHNFAVSSRPLRMSCPHPNLTVARTV